MVQQCKTLINSNNLPEQALTTHNTKSKGRNRKMSDILSKLPKAPGTNSTPSPLDDDLFDHNQYTFDDLPDINDIETPAETESQQSGSRRDIPYELLDTKEFESLVHAASRARSLIGSPAGYIGYEDGGLLTDAIRKTPNCVLLLDEIEKAHRIQSLRFAKRNYQI